MLKKSRKNIFLPHHKFIEDHRSTDLRCCYNKTAWLSEARKKMGNCELWAQKTVRIDHKKPSKHQSYRESSFFHLFAILSGLIDQSRISSVPMSLPEQSHILSIASGAPPGGLGLLWEAQKRRTDPGLIDQSRDWSISPGKISKRRKNGEKWRFTVSLMLWWVFMIDSHRFFGSRVHSSPFFFRPSRCNAVL